MAVAPSAPVSARDHHPKKAKRMRSERTWIFQPLKKRSGCGQGGLRCLRRIRQQKARPHRPHPEAAAVRPDRMPTRRQRPDPTAPPPAPPAPRPLATPAPPELLHRLGASWGFSRDVSLFPASLRLALRPPASKRRRLRQGELRRPQPHSGGRPSGTGRDTSRPRPNFTNAREPSGASRAARIHASPRLSLRPSRSARAKVACGSVRQVRLQYS